MQDVEYGTTVSVKIPAEGFCVRHLGEDLNPLERRGRTLKLETVKSILLGITAFCLPPLAFPGHHGAKGLQKEGRKVADICGI